VDTALLLLQRLDVTPDDLRAVPAARPPVPTFAEYIPGSFGDRLRGNATKLRGYADAHDRTRITLNQDDTNKDAG